MNQIELGMAVQAADTERHKLAHLKKFQMQLETIIRDQTEVIHQAALDGGMSAAAGADRMVRAGGAHALLAIVPDWLEQQAARVKAGDEKVAQATARHKAEREVDNEENARLVAAFRGDPAAEKAAADRKQAERNARVQSRAQEIAAVK